ncbi:MAG: FecR domain-containing protein [Bacteroidota bacterium]|nr:FecR domain-containing protein [Bacteroidota bacterium]
MDELIIKYCQNKCSAEEVQRLFDWIDESQDNKSYYKQIRNIWDLNTLLNNQSVSQNEIQQKYSEIRPAVTLEPLKDNPDKRNRNPFQYWVRIAAALIIGFGLSWAYNNYQVKRQSVVWNKIEVPIGQRVHITLSDGSKVWLNSKSKLFYPGSFSQKDRTVRLDGEAYFEVTHDAKHPFFVQTPYTEVEVKGTKFDVYAYSDLSLVTTTLIEGKILLNLKNKNHDAFEMNPNQQIRYNSNTNKITIIRNYEASNAIDWISGIWGIVDMPFKELIQQLEQHYNVKILVQNKKLLDSRCTGKFRYDESLEDVFDVIQISIPFKYRKEGNKILIDKR